MMGSLHSAFEDVFLPVAPLTRWPGVLGYVFLTVYSVYFVLLGALCSSLFVLANTPCRKRSLQPLGETKTSFVNLDLLQTRQGRRKVLLRFRAAPLCSIGEKEVCFHERLT